MLSSEEISAGATSFLALSSKVSFLYTSWMAEMNRDLP